ncbi:hypothetical protein HV819_10165 [Anaerococcus sp. AGMB00486]|uniref:Uncharacterized protein n=1 Tax=Anaerococcus faecalis TaxID=2742993 RepID=A0ABX2NC73_9FIRM|nr:hypothetical protein [Anaerococcus faecalis]NVF12320.1 hypothetical protein [Anaerococcus faecalis]
MNGQVSQIMKMTAVTKRILKYHEMVEYTPEYYVNSISFEVKWIFGKTKKLKSFKDWVRHIQKFNYKDVKVYINPDVQDPGLLGFSNTNDIKIILHLLNGKIIEYRPTWYFNENIRKWDISYVEEKIDNPKIYEDGTTFDIYKFDSLLDEISKFASDIGAENFAKIFSNAKNTLNRNDFPRQYMHILLAASESDVFGAMGSWNDEPYGMAAEKGLLKEYERLSKALVRENRLAAMYCINNW